jgi:uracil DNA glycosylase
VDRGNEILEEMEGCMETDQVLREQLLALLQSCHPSPLSAFDQVRKIIQSRYHGLYAQDVVHYERHGLQ